MLEWSVSGPGIPSLASILGTIAGEAGGLPTSLWASLHCWAYLGVEAVLSGLLYHLSNHLPSAVLLPS
jgi:hypothetical protein